MHYDLPHLAMRSNNNKKKISVSIFSFFENISILYTNENSHFIRYQYEQFKYVIKICLIYIGLRDYLLEKKRTPGQLV